MNTEILNIIIDFYMKYCFQIGPNVSIGPGVHVGAGVRIHESIVLANAIVDDHSLILYSIIGTGSRVGKWARVEGTPTDPDPNKPFAKMENLPLFNKDGRLNPSITILGECLKLFLQPWRLFIIHKSFIIRA